MNKIKILDCTLRDGGYINEWKFDESQILKIISSLEKSNVNIIECGYLDEKKGEVCNSTLYRNVTDIDHLISKQSNKSLKKVIMINMGDFNCANLPPKSETKIDGIRFAFHKKDLKHALADAKVIIEKGYELFFQPMVSVLYSSEEFTSLIQHVNELNPYAFYIVDSFGSMMNEDLEKYINLTVSHLNKEINIGFHSHNNLQLAFSNSIYFIESLSNRNVIVDSSIYGMGRGAGNLNTELIIEYLNKHNQSTYKIDALLEVIDDYLESIHQEKYWGFSLAYYLSGKLKLHPNYATYLINKKSIPVQQINEVLKEIVLEKKYSFDKEYIEKLYLKQLESENHQNFKFLDKNTTILVIASGKSVISNQVQIQEFISNKKPCVITLNHKYDEIKSDYFFYSNPKRFIEFQNEIKSDDKLIITSNIDSQSVKCQKQIVNFNTLYNDNDLKNDNVAILLLNLLVRNSIKKVFIAGLDGYDIHSDENYSYVEHARILDKQTMTEQNCKVSESLKKLQSLMDIKIITPTRLLKDNLC